MIKGQRSKFQIVAREDFSDATFLLQVHHPMMARAARPGQFVIVMSHAHGERIPLTIADYDRDDGTVTLVLNTPFGNCNRSDAYEIREAAITNGVPCITTLAGILAAKRLHGGPELLLGQGVVVALIGQVAPHLAQKDQRLVAGLAELECEIGAAARQAVRDLPDPIGEPTGRHDPVSVPVSDDGDGVRVAEIAKDRIFTRLGHGQVVM